MCKVCGQEYRQEYYHGVKVRVCGCVDMSSRSKRKIAVNTKRSPKGEGRSDMIGMNVISATKVAEDKQVKVKAGQVVIIANVDKNTRESKKGNTTHASTLGNKPVSGEDAGHLQVNLTIWSYGFAEEE